MTNPNFTASISTNELYRDLDTTVCLTDLLDGYDSDILALETSVNSLGSAYAPVNHTHDDDYADIDHTHSASDITGLSTGNNGITESGTSGIWTYEKYDSGKLVCEGLITCSGTFNKRYWEMRYRDATETYPVAFVTSAPMVQATAQCDIGFPQVTIYNNTLTTVGVRAFNPYDPINDVKVAIRAVGKWK